MNPATSAISPPAPASSRMATLARPAGPRILVVESEPAGVRFAHEYLRRQPSGQITLFGVEPCCPYNRVKLSLLLAGDISLTKPRESASNGYASLVSSDQSAYSTGRYRHQLCLRSA